MAQIMQKDVQAFELAVLDHILFLIVRIHLVLENRAYRSAELPRMVSLCDEQYFKR